MVLLMDYEMLPLSVYFKHGNLDFSPQLVGEHKRRADHNGQGDLSDEPDHRLGLQLKGSSEKVSITDISTVSASEQV